MSSSALLVALPHLDDPAFSGSYASVTAQNLARRLKAFGIASKMIRFGATTKGGYERAGFEDAWGRYLQP